MHSTHIFFDLDGTLYDSQNGIVNSLRHACRSLQLPDIPRDRRLSFIGPAIQDIFAELLGNENHRFVQKGVALYRAHYRTRGLFDGHLYPGVPALLQALTSARRTLVLTTSKPWTFATKVLEHFQLSSHFEAVYGPELDGTRKDKAELVAHALSQLGLDAHRVIMVGDRRHDIEAARKNRLPCVGVLWGYGGERELKDAGADRLCHSVERLYEMLVETDEVRTK